MNKLCLVGLFLVTSCSSKPSRVCVEWERFLGGPINSRPRWICKKYKYRYMPLTQRNKRNKIKTGTNKGK